MDAVFIPKPWAEQILAALDVSYSEGMGPASPREMVNWIASRYPDLAVKYQYLPWVKKMETL